MQHLKNFMEEIGEIMNYEQVCDDLTRAEKSIKVFMHSECRTESEKESLKRSLELVREAKENCRLVQAGHTYGHVRAALTLEIEQAPSFCMQENKNKQKTGGK